MEYTIDEMTTSTTLNVGSTTLNAGKMSKIRNNGSWDISQMYSSGFTPDELIKAVDLVDRFLKKYPNDETIQAFDEILRDELCHMFGGRLEE